MLAVTFFFLLFNSNIVIIIAAAAAAGTAGVVVVVVVIQSDELIGFNLLHMVGRNKGHLVLDTPMVQDFGQGPSVVYFDNFVGESILDQEGQCFFLFAHEELSFLKSGAELLPGSTIVRLVGDQYDRFPRQDVKTLASVDQSRWIVDVAAVVTAVFDQGWVRFKNHVLGHVFI